MVPVADPNIQERRRAAPVHDVLAEALIPAHMNVLPVICTTLGRRCAEPWQMGTLLDSLATRYAKRTEDLNRTYTELAGARETAESAKTAAQSSADHALALEQALAEVRATRYRYHAEREELHDRLHRYEATVTRGYAILDPGFQR